MVGFIVNINEERRWGIIASEGQNFRFFSDDLPEDIQFSSREMMRVVTFDPHYSDRGRKATKIRSK
ncbi:hypothetical protein [Lacipirellula limnantheis]|uniref:Uncharacterized protein n=1 Tax=Lacipirellula limnantheis TaxID=2528024 RepID=A0A517U1D9_9BACT|nr:hypothetical protein [Lacipirellula limnantheis]QDT74427.1 hypothetical protein I41_36230 [Lacipirellula limnantheis]